ncbi:MAG: hypothetical protein ACI4PO_03875 [Faecousia sp.]
MSIIFLAKGTATMGRTKRDKDGNIVESSPAQFTVDDAGPCVAVGELDPETMQPKDPVTGLFGDYDASGYLSMALELLHPSRRVNLPDFAAIIRAAMKDGVYFCDYCEGYGCMECAVKEWKEEAES